MTIFHMKRWSSKPGCKLTLGQGQSVQGLALRGLGLLSLSPHCLIAFLPHRAPVVPKDSTS